MELLEENIILKNLITNPEYFDKVIPYLDIKQFKNNYSKKIFNCIYQYNLKYNKQPNIPVIELFVEHVKATANEYQEMLDFIGYAKTDEYYEYNWLLDETLNFIHNREYFSALSDAAEKYDKNVLDTELPEKVNQALAITFDSSIGMELTDTEIRWKMYTEKEDRIPFLLEQFNTITKGGCTRGTLNCLMSSNTGGFKSGCLVNFTCNYAKLGYNVLYLSFEMSENKVMERIDANLLDTPIDDLTNMGKEVFENRIQQLVSKTFGRIIVKQYPTSSCNAGHIRSLLKELKLKQNFKPDIIVFDYLGIMASQRFTKDVAEHQMIKAATEEVRGLCVEENVVGWTAMQSNRQGASKDVDISLSDISASYSSSFGFDFILAVITSPEYDEMNKIRFKQIKNRYGDCNINNNFFMGLSKPKMKLYDLDSNQIPSYSIEAEQEMNRKESQDFAEKMNALSQFQKSDISLNKNKLSGRASAFSRLNFDS